MSPEQYVKAVVINVEEDLARSGKRLPSKCATPLSSNYASYLEDFPKLMVDGMQRYQELVVHMRWFVEIRRLDILLETSLLLSYLAMPRVRHLKQEFGILGYLKAHPKRKLGFDLAHPDINENWFQQCDWTGFYREAEEAIPGNIPVARGNFILTHCFVDAYPYGDTKKR